MRVRIRTTPVEREMDGVKLDRLAPGAVRDVSTSLAQWLIVEGYAEPEMRSVDIDGAEGPSSSLPPSFDVAHDRRARRNSTQRPRNPNRLKS